MKLIVCPECGAGIEPNSTRCWLCGADVSASQPTSNPVPLRKIVKIVGAIVFTVGALAVAGVVALFVTCFAAVANIR